MVDTTDDGAQASTSRRRTSSRIVRLLTIVAVSAGTVTTLAAASPDPAAPTADRCQLPRLTLLEARIAGARVAVEGLAHTEYAGRPAVVQALRGSKQFGRPVTVTVRPDGRFSASLPRPAVSARHIIRYRATVSSRTSQTLRLVRRMAVTSRTKVATGTVVSGRITGKPARWNLAITAQTCTATKPVARVTTTRTGDFKVTIPAPGSNDPVTLYRAKATQGRKQTFSEILMATVPPVQPQPPDATATPQVVPAPPRAVDDQLTASEDTPVTVSAADLLSNDTGGLSLTGVAAGADTRGTVAGNGERVTYTPEGDFNGAASFDYAATDDRGNGTAASVRVTVREVNDVPITVDDTRTVAGSTLHLATSALTANDSPGPPDEHGQTLIVTDVTSQTHGTASLTLGMVTFTADAGFNGPATFTYRACDDGTTAGAADPRCDEATVGVTVSQPPGAPTAQDVAVTTDEDTVAAVTLMATMAAPGTLSYKLLSAPTHGSVTPVDAGPAARIYTPDVDFNGPDSFSYNAGTGTTDSNTATVTVNVREVNDPPLAVADAKAVVHDRPLTFPVAHLIANDRPGPANESDQTLAVTSAEGATHGTVTLAGSDIAYTPEAGYRGPASFSYRVCDDGRTRGIADPRCDTATVAVTVGDASVTELSVTPSAPSIADGESVQFRATAKFNDGSTREVTGEVTWASSSPAVATITDGGAARGGEAGVATISAALGGARAETTLTVAAARITEIIVEPDALALLTGESQQLHATGVLSDGTSENVDGRVTWSTGDTDVATVTSVGVALGVGSGDTAVRATLGAVSGTTDVSVRSTVVDDVPPVADIASPAEDADVSAPTDVIGTATDANLLKYTVELAPVGETAFTLIEERATPVLGGVLGRVDSTQLRNDLYTVRLTVYDRGGNIATDTTIVQVIHDLKIGNFSLTFQDIEVPLAGMPISINRVYDSREKRRGDFGVGWRLDVQALQLRTTPGQGRGWLVNRTGGLFPTFTIVAGRTHKVSVTLPDGEVEEFDMVPSPATSVLLPFQFINATYQPRAGTHGRLRLLGGGTDLFVMGAQPGEVELVNDEFEPFDPRTFEYTAANGNVFVISPSGVQSIRDLNGNTLTFGSGGVTHSAGTAVTFTRDAQGRITEIRDPDGRITRYAYDARGDLSSHTDAGGNRTRFFYNRSHGLIEVRDPRGYQAARNEYDDGGRLVAVIDAAGHRTTFDHDVAGRQEVVRDRRGNATVYEYDLQGNIVKKTDALGGITRRTYDANGNELSVTNPLGHTSRKEYDARGNVIKEIDATGATITRTFNERSQVLAQTDANGRTTTSTYDSKGNTLSEAVPGRGTIASTFDGGGRRMTTTDAAGGVFRYTYDARGLMAGQTDAAGKQTTFSYDASGNRVRDEGTRMGPGGATIPVVSTTRYDDRNRPVEIVEGDSRFTLEYGPTGQLIAHTDSRGARTSYAYDNVGRLARATFADGTFETASYDADGNRVSSTDRAGRTTSYEYDAFDRVTRTIRPDGTALRTTYDAAGRVTSRTDARGNTTSYAYDDAGHLTREEGAEGAITSYAYDLKGNRTRMTDPRGKVTLYEYDAGDRIVKTTHPDGRTRTVDYDGSGRKRAVTDEAGAHTSFAYDELGRLKTVTDALGGETTYSYDEVGNLVAVSDARSNVTRFAYDDSGRITRRTLPAGQAETFAYDANGNVTAHVDFNGATTTSAYDVMNRPTMVTRPDEVTNFSYTPSGLPASIRDRNGETTTAYDALDRVIRTEKPDGASIGYRYDADGRRTATISAAGTVNYGYDAAGRLREVVDPAGRSTAYAYDASGNRTNRLLPNGARTSYEYDDRNQLTGLRHANADGGVLAAFDYTLDAVGRRTGVTQSGGRSSTYGYDALGRLVSETVTDPARGNRATSFTYDAVGNRVTSTTSGTMTTSTYDANDRQLTAGAETFAHDANGNLTRRGAATFTYDAANRLVTTGGALPATTYAYDFGGNRIARTTGGQTTRYLVDTNQAIADVLEEQPPAGPRVHYVRGAGLISQGRGAAISYFHADALGSTRALTNTMGAVTDRYDYSAFGEDAGTTGTTANDFRFAGEQYEPELAGYYLRARHYDPATGRFLSLDPDVLGDRERPLSMHEYLYANADPVNMVDPTGRFAALASFSVSISMGNALNGIRIGAGLTFLAKAAATVVAVAVAACAANAAISAVTAIGSSGKCDITKANIFYPGWDTQQTTLHIATAILSGRPANLTWGTNPHSRSWYGSDPRCAGRSRLMWCDEYPFYSTWQGGPGASLQLVPGPEQWYQGIRLSVFYRVCKMVKDDPVDGRFGVVPGATPVTGHQCK